MRALRALRALRGLRTFGALSALSALSALGLAACDDDIVAPERGSLAVTITGLPTGQAASVTVAGPGGFSRALTATTTLDDLLPGNYGITASNVEHPTEGRWVPTPADQSIVVPAGAGTTNATVTYSLATARLAVNITGLPAGVNANVTVSGPGYNNVLTSSTAINFLTPGAYTITAANVTSGGTTYAATPATQTIQLPASTTQVAANVVYAPATGRLTVTIAGLPNGAAGSVTVTGPGGFSAAVSATTTLDVLTPGTYTITAANTTFDTQTYQPTPVTQTVQVTASATPAAATVTYGLGTGSLTVTINGLSGVAAAVTVTGPGGYSQQVTATQTLGSLTPGTYTIAAASVTSSLTTHTPAPTTQTATITSGGTATRTVTYTSSALILTSQQQWGAAFLGDVIYLTSPPNDPRIFVVDQQGQIFVIKNGAPLATPFLDIRSIVSYGGEQGLLSMAFDPAYATNGRFYVYYNDLNGDIAVARYTATPTADVANAGSRTTVLTIPHPIHANHNGGLALFGPDGMLYLATGDGGSGGANSQDINSLLGKVLRIDVTNLPYTIPAGNPYAGATPGADEIWARGLRNPWRYAFDPPAGTLYVADVGEGMWEEVNAVAAATAGVNYGWRIMEGNHCFPADPCNGAGLTTPVLEYSHAGGHCSVTGGFVYRGTAIPELTGHYLYADYCTGIVRSFRLSGGQAIEQRTWFGGVGNIKSFGLDAAGEMYILSQNGHVYRIVKQ